MREPLVASSPQTTSVFSVYEISKFWSKHTSQLSLAVGSPPKAATEMLASQKLLTYKVSSAGKVSQTGAMLSYIMMVCSYVELWSQSSVAVQVRCQEPMHPPLVNTAETV